jgi:8-oxo-dGTP pyrophosphatase MutT (NUDIX family)
VSYVDRLDAIRRWTPGAYRPFVVAGVRVGRVTHAFARRLADFNDVFAVTDEAVHLRATLTTPDARSEAVHEVGERLVAAGDIQRLRGETYGVAATWDAPDLMRLDRGLVPWFGTRSYGVHVNGFVGHGGDQGMWIGRRALDKRVAPGKLDHMVAGGVSHGYGIRDTLVKEAAEEADVPATLAARARPVGALNYICEAESGLRDDTLFVFDLEVPPDFTPENTDGELTGFERWALPDVMARVRDSEAFKFNVAPVLVDFFFRHGWLDPDADTGYAALSARLHGMAAATD